MVAVGDPDAEVTVGADFSDIGAELERVITAALKGATDDIVAGLRKAFTDLGKVVSKSFGNSFNDVAQDAKNTKRVIDDLRGTFEKLNKTSNALKGSFGPDFDPDNVLFYKDQLERLVTVQNQLEKGAGRFSKTEFTQITAQLRGLQSGVIASRDAFLSAARAADELDRNRNRNARETSRATRDALKQENARFVVAEQSKASAARDSARLQVEATRAASRQRVAIIQAAVRTISTLEKSLRNVFRSTADVISSAFKSIGRTASTTVNNLTKAVRSSTTQISNDYSQSFRNSTKTVQNELNQQTSAIRNFTQNATSQLSSVGSVTGGAKFGVGAAVGGLLGVGAAKALSGGFDRAANIETAGKAFNLFLQDAEKAAQLTADILEVVQGTPFRLDQFATAASQLLAFNIEVEKVPELLSTISDAAAISLDPGQTVDRLVRTFGQIQSAGKVTTEDLNQLTEAGVPAFDLLGNSIGKTVEEMRDLISEGAIPAGVAIDSLIKGIREGTDGLNGPTIAFGGLAKTLGGTLRGAVSNFNTAIQRLGANIITAFGPLFLSAVGAATAAIDFIGKALLSFAKAVTETAAAKGITRLFTQLTETIKDSAKTLQPLFDLIGDGLVTVGAALGALKGLKLIPGLFSAIGATALRILSPFNLLIAASVLLTGYFKKLLDENGSLRAALENLGNVLRKVLAPAAEIIKTVFSSIATVFRERFAPAVSDAGGAVGDKFLPILSTVNKFIRDKIVPAVEGFADTLKEKLIPLLRTGLRTAIKFSITAFETLRNAAREIAEVVGPVLERGLEIGRTAFSNFYEFLSGTFLPFIQNNLAPALAGVGAAVAVTTISGGNLPLGAVAGLGAAAAVALSNPEIRNALATTIQGAVSEAQKFLGNLFDSVTSGNILIGALKVANQVGKVLGDIVSDRRLLTAVAAVAGLAAAFAVSFIAGFAEGIARNIPELVSTIGDALEVGFGEAIKAIIKNPKIGLALAGIFAGAAVIRSLVKASRQTGALIADGLKFGLNQSGNLSGGNSTKGFLTALIGGPSAVQRAGTESGAAYSRAFSKQITKNRDLVKALTGRAIPGLTQSNVNGSFGPIEANAKNLRTSTTAVQGLITQYGAATVAGAQFRLGLGQINTGLRNLTTGGLSQAKAGFGNLATALKTSGKQIGQSVGVVAGAAFATSFIAQALFDANTSGKDKLVAGFGTLLTTVGAGAQVGGGFGALAGGVVGAGIIGIAALTGGFEKNDEAARDAADAFKVYADALRDATKIELPQIVEDTFKIRLANATSGVLTALDDINFKYEDFAKAVTDGTVTKEFGDISFLANQGVDALNDFANAKPVVGFENILLDLAAVNVTGQDAADVLDFLQAEIVGIGDASERFNITDNLLGSGATGLEGRIAAAATQMGKYRQETELTKATTTAFKDKLSELNDQRLDRLRDSVNFTKNILAEAKTAAEDARTALVDYLNGDYNPQGLKAVTDQAVLDAAAAARSLSQPVVEGLTPEEIAAGTNQTLQKIADAASGVLATGLDEFGADFTDEKALTALAPLINGVSGIGGPGGEAAFDAILEVFNRRKDEIGQTLTGNVVSADSKDLAATARANSAQNRLDEGLKIDPAKIPTFVAEAKKAAEDVAAGVAEGFATIDGDTRGTDAIKTWSDNIIEEALSAFQVNSPSVVFQNIGKFTAQGFVNGLKNGDAAARTAGTNLMRQVVAGVAIAGGTQLILDAGTNAGLAFATGLRRSTLSVVVAARAVATAAVNAMKSVLQINSPSKVFQGLGQSTMEGFALGIESSAGLAADAALTAMQGVVGAASSAVIGDVTVAGSASTLMTDAASQARAIATPVTPGANGAVTATLSTGDITSLATAITTASKPPVTIDQTFNEKVDSRAVATDIAWRLTV